MRFKSFKLGILKKNQEHTPDSDELLSSKIAELEEQVNDRTKILEEAGQQLNELTGKATEPAEDEDIPPHAHGPLSELSIDPEDIEYEETIFDTVTEEQADDIKMIEIKTEEVTATDTSNPAENPTEQAIGEEDNSFNSLFNDDEEEVNPLAGLISSLPDVTAQELINDLREIKDIIQEWQSVRKYSCYISPGISTNCTGGKPQ